jgi:hypothetical protein
MPSSLPGSSTARLEAELPILLGGEVIVAKLSQNDLAI